MDRPLRVFPSLASAPQRPADPRVHAPGRRLQPLGSEVAGGTRCRIRNVRVGARRTTLRLEGAFWDAFDALCARENTTVDRVLSGLESEREGEALTSTVRSYLIAYWRRCAGEP